jgi:hypothetical protein
MRWHLGPPRSSAAAWRQRPSPIVSPLLTAARRFAVWMTARRRGATLASSDAEDAAAYRADLVARGYAPSTINTALTALRLFLAACGRDADNPFHRIPLLRQK